MGQKTKVCKVCNKRKKLDQYHSKRSDCKMCRAAKENKPAPEPIELRITVPRVDRYVVTYAQDFTRFNREVLASLRKYCDHNKAELVVKPGTYHNPTSIAESDKKVKHQWDKILEPHLVKNRFDIGKNLTVYCDVPIQPTAKRPLSGFEEFAGKSSAIFAHPAVEFKTVPTSTRKYPRIFTTTGALTVPHYSDSKSGKRGEKHHTYGASVVEKCGDYFHVRQISAQANGTFCDLGKKYTPTNVSDVDQVEVLACGDLHAEKFIKEVMGATFFGDDSIVSTLRPKTIMLHDVLDFDTRNHHRRGSLLDKVARAYGHARNVVRDEVQFTVEMIDQIAELGAEVYIVASNHDEAFDRWLTEVDPRTDPINAEFHYEMNYRRCKNIREKGWTPPAFEMYYNLYGKGRVKFLRRNQSIKIKGIEYGFHGDHGLNGSRGSILAYSKLGVKTTIGHSHSPGIIAGCHQVGVTADLDQGYNFLPSGWLNTHDILYPTGKRSLISVIDGKWRHV